MDSKYIPKFENKTKSNLNKDADIMTLDFCLELTEGFTSSFPDFHIIQENGFNIIDESKASPVGAKARFAEFFMNHLKSIGVNHVVYVAPRRGFAPISLSYICRKLDIDLTLVMPSSKKASPHQLYCIQQGAQPRFLRIASMPNANIMAKKLADAMGAFFIPLGLDHPLVVAGAVRCIHDQFKDREHPKRMWSVISTGVLQRSLQIALPNTEFHAVAVARNIQEGELGRAAFYSYHKIFNSNSDVIPEFDCEPAYDSKGFHYMQRFGAPGDWFFSVAGEAPESTMKPELVDSYRDWNDKRDFPELF